VNHFLDTVLPTQGRLCVAEFSGPKRRHLFFDDVPAMDAAIAALPSTSDIYFTPTSFNADRRVAENADLIRSIFVDLDCGVGKPFADQAEAAQALRAFVNTSGLPIPTFIINSGGGLHVYWVFERDLDIPTWGPAARAMKALCLQHKFQIDPAITADSVRLMRVPGTYNNKGNQQRPVQILRSGAVVNFDDFCALLPPMAPVVDLSAASVYGMDNTTEALARSDMDPCNFARIVKKSMAGAAGCAQMKRALLEAETLEEPLWRGALSIAWNCEDGSTAVHKLSRAHPGYTPEATLTKAKALTGKPYTCDWYRDNYPETCRGCPHKVGSPIVLGRTVQEAPANPDGSYTVTTTIDTLDSDVPLTLQTPPLPRGYFRGKNGGIYQRVAGTEDEPGELEVCSNDIYVLERFFDSDGEGDGEGEQCTLCVILPKDGVRQFVTPLTTLLATDTLRQALSKNGVVAYGKQIGVIMGYIAASIKNLQSKNVSHKTRNQMGWTPERTFVIGNVEHTPSGPKLAPPASNIRAIVPWFAPKGTLEVWKQIISTYNTPGMEPLAFAFLVGAGSPLLQLLNSDQVRGGVVHLVSNGSGSGKTSVQMAINSLFGNPKQLLLLEDDTYNSKIHSLGLRNSICVTVDEITNMSPAEISEFVYSATSGRGKHRMEAQSNKLRVNHSSWCLFSVTSGNAVLSDQLLANKSAAEGELKRLVELRVPMPEKDVSREMVRIFNQLGSNYGTAGPMYIQHIVSNYQVISLQMAAIHERLVSQQGFDRTDRFYTAILTCATMAGKILKELGLADFDLHRILAKAMATVRGSKHTAEASAGSPNTMALETLSGFINEHQNGMLVIKSEKSNEAEIRTPTGPLRMRYEPDTQELIIIASELRNYFTARRVDVRSSVQEFIKMRALKPALNGEPTQSRRPASGIRNSSLRGAPVRCYVFNAPLLGLQDLVSDEPSTEP
jgi:hypothetical protein